MRSQVLGVPQDHIAQRAALDADVFLLNLLLEVWEQHQLKSVTDPLGIERKGILKILTVSIMGLSSVEEARHLNKLLGRLLLRDNLHILLAGQNLLCELSDLRRPILLIDHIKP